MEKDFCKVNDWVFIEIFSILIQKAKRKIPLIKTQILLAKPITAREIEKKIKELNKGIRLSNLETSHPEMGKPISELTGMVSNKLPN